MKYSETHSNDFFFTFNDKMLQSQKLIFEEKKQLKKVQPHSFCASCEEN